MVSLKKFLVRLRESEILCLASFSEFAAAEMSANANAKPATAAPVAALQQRSMTGEIYVQTPGDNDVLCGRVSSVDLI